MSPHKNDSRGPGDRFPLSRAWCVTHGLENKERGSGPAYLDAVELVIVVARVGLVERSVVDGAFRANVNTVVWPVDAFVQRNIDRFRRRSLLKWCSASRPSLLLFGGCIGARRRAALGPGTHGRG